MACGFGRIDGGTAADADDDIVIPVTKSLYEGVHGLGRSEFAEADTGHRKVSFFKALSQGVLHDLPDHIVGYQQRCGPQGLQMASQLLNDVPALDVPGWGCQDMFDDGAHSHSTLIAFS